MQRKIDFILEPPNVGELEKKEKKKDKDSTLNKRKTSKEDTRTINEKKREAHEHYQLILSEYHRRVKQRVRSKMSTINRLGKRKMGECECFWAPQKVLENENGIPGNLI